MNDKDRNSYLDDLLDRSLTQYGRVEPRAGLEERLLIQVRSAKQVQPRKSIWVWYLAPAAVAAAVLLFMVIPWKEGEPAHPGTPVAAGESPTGGAVSVETAAKPAMATVEPSAGGVSSVETAVEPPVAQVASSVGEAALVEPVAKRPLSPRAPPLARSASAMAGKRAASFVLIAETSRPKRDIFPTPEPLSEMDIILLQLLRDNSTAAAHALSRIPTAEQALEKIQIAELSIPLLVTDPITIPSLEQEKRELSGAEKSK